MRCEPIEDKTSVYSFGNLACDHLQTVRSKDAYAEPASRTETPPVPEDRNPLAAVTLLLGIALGVVLLVTALLGQSRMTAMNDEAAALSSEITALREEQTVLRIEYEKTRNLRHAEQYAAETLGMSRPGGDQIVYLEAAMPDKATVLNVRRGQGLAHLWEELIDTVGECFH